jgi:hypothetical protein
MDHLYERLERRQRAVDRVSTPDKRCIGGPE